LKHIELNNEVMVKKDGFYNLQKDQDALHVFLETVEGKEKTFGSLKERLDFMIKETYYEDVFIHYTLEEIEALYIIARAQSFKFQSYMAAFKFYTDYALKTNDGSQYLEGYEDRVVSVALCLARGDMEQACKFVQVMMEQSYQPATPTFLNAGRGRRGEMVSCFLLEMDDSLNSIGFNIGASLNLSKIGGGVALNLSKLRARGESIKGFENASSGVVPVMKLLENSFSYANQLGQRKGAGAAYLNVFHQDVMEFLDTKKINADEKSRIQTLSIGLVVPRKLFDLAEKNLPMYVFAPYTVYKAYGIHLDDMDLDGVYEELVANPEVKKTRLDLSARDFLIKMATIQLESGYPYLVYKSNANEQHPLKELGQIKMSNLCTEIFQLQETSIISDYGKDDRIKRDISCNLGSLNIVNVMERKGMKNAVHTGMRALTAVSDMTTIVNAPSVKKANEELHAVGLGAMNLHGYLAKNQIDYDGPLAMEFVNTFFMMMNYYSIEASMEIAKEKGVTFKDFEKSEYANGAFFKKYEETSFAPTSDKIQSLFEGMEVPSRSDWSTLKKKVAKHGLYHAYRLAIAPTQSISYVQNATPSVMPIVDVIESRTYANSTTYYPMPYLSMETFWYYKSAYNTDQFKIIDLVAQMQQHIDQGISTILYVNSDVSTRDLARYYIYASKKGLKSLYYTRTRHTTVEDCLTCSV